MSMSQSQIVSEGDPSSDSDESFSYYLSELYRNLNLLSGQIQGLNRPEDLEMESDEVIRAMEGRFNEWMGSFYNILIYLFCTTIVFLISLINPNYRPFAVIVFLLFPFYLYFVFLYSIPEVRLNNQVVFSRKDLTIGKQFELVKSLFTFFLRQLYENSKKGVLVLGVFVFLLAWNLYVYYVLN